MYSFEFRLNTQTPARVSVPVDFVNKSQKLADKITAALGANPQLDVYYDTTTAVTTPAVKGDINYSLKQKVPGLTSDDLNSISYTGANPDLTANYRDYTLNITFNDAAGDKTTLPIKAKMLSRADTSTKIVNNIKSKVTCNQPNYSEIWCK